MSKGAEGKKVKKGEKKENNIKLSTLIKFIVLCIVMMNIAILWYAYML